MSQTDGNLSNNHEITLRELFKILKKTFLSLSFSQTYLFHLDDYDSFWGEIL